jgi:hypothetical protein
VQRLRMRGAIPPFPQYVFMTCCLVTRRYSDNLTLTRSEADKQTAFRLLQCTAMYRHEHKYDDVYLFTVMRSLQYTDVYRHEEHKCDDLCMCAAVRSLQYTDVYRYEEHKCGDLYCLLRWGSCSTQMRIVMKNINVTTYICVLQWGRCITIHIALTLTHL